jgi:hypothetical protein
MANTTGNKYGGKIKGASWYVCKYMKEDNYEYI